MSQFPTPSQSPNEAVPPAPLVEPRVFVPPTSDFTLRDALYTVFRHKFKILLLFLLTSVGATLYVVRAPDYYVSEARLLVQNNRQNLTANPNVVNGAVLTNAPAQGNLVPLRPEIGMIRSYELAARVVDRVGVAKVLWTPPKPGETARMHTPGQAEEPAAGWNLEATTERLRELTEQFKKELHLDTTRDATRDWAIQVLLQNLEVQPDMSGSNVLLLSYRAFDPDLAQEILTAITETFVALHLEANRYDVPAEFLDDQARAYEAQLKEKEEALAALKKELDITSLAARKDQLQQQLNQLETSYKDSQVLVTRLRARINVWESMLKAEEQAGARRGGATRPAAPAAAAAANPLTAAMRQRLMDLELEEKRLAARFTDQNPQLREVRDNIASLKALIAAQEVDPTTGEPAVLPAIDPSQQSLKMQLQSDRAELDGQLAAQRAILTQVEEARQKLDRLLDREREVVSLEREVQFLERELMQYKASLQTARIADFFDEAGVSNVKVYQQPTLSRFSQKNVRKLLVLWVFGSLSGLGAGIVLAFALDFLNPTLRRPEDVERYLGLPVIVSIPRTRRHRPLIARPSA